MSKQTRKTSMFAVVILLLSQPLAILAQEGTATLSGTIVDSNGAVLAGAHVSIVNQTTGLNRRTITTGDSGDFVVQSLIPGIYRVSVEAAGFKTVIRENLSLEVGKTQELRIAMEVGATSESINVTAEASMIETTSKEIGGHINQKEMIELPSINRNFIGFVGLLPGVVANISTESFGSDSVSVNGQDPRYNNYLLDGSNNNDDVIGQRAGAQTRTALEAVQEFQVLTNQFDAEFGRTSGAIINAITKSGTNQFHGSGYGFFQDNRLNASNRFAVLNKLEDPDANVRQYGFTFGGPIKKNLAHFFTSLERYTIAEGVIIDIPARPEFNASTTENTRALNTTVRFDTQPTKNNQLAARWLRESSPQFNQIIGAVTLDARREEFDIDTTVVGSWTSILSPNLVNDMRVNFTREDVAFANPGFNSGTPMTDLPPTLVFQSFTAQQSNVAQARINNSYRLADTASWVRNAHSMKFGFEYNYVTAANDTHDLLNGQFTFPTNLSFNASDFRTYPERFSIRVGGPSHFVNINHNPSFFAQDNWKVTNRFTLNLGLRYDDETISDDNNNFSPRLGFAYDPKGDGKMVIRAGYGFFYQNTPFELINAFRTAGPFSTSFVRNFPLNAADPGPRAGNRPTDPTLRNGPTVDRALVASLVGTSSVLPNPNPTVDNTERRMPYVRSASVGLQRELVTNLALTVDYIHQDGIDQLMTINLNPGTRATTASTAAITRRFTTLGAVIQNSQVPVTTDLFSSLPFETLGVSSVTTRVNDGRTHYDALQLSLDKRFSKGFQFKTAYTLSKGRGNMGGVGTPNSNFQLLDDLRLDLNEGPTDLDRRHNFVVSGIWEVPHTRGLMVSSVVRALQGAPFTIVDNQVDLDRNGILFDPLPAGSRVATRTFPNGETLTFEHENDGGRNGARLPGYFSADLRLAYKYNFTERFKAGFTFEVFNLTNRTNFDPAVLGNNFSSFQQGTNRDFLVQSGAQIPRTMQLGFRLSF